jgi:hypothetical protein
MQSADVLSGGIYLDVAWAKEQGNQQKDKRDNRRESFRGLAFQNPHLENLLICDQSVLSLAVQAFDFLPASLSPVVWVLSLPCPSA